MSSAPSCVPLETSPRLTLLFVPGAAVLHLPAGAPGPPLQSELKEKTEDVVTQLGAVGAVGAVGSSLVLFTFPLSALLLQAAPGGGLIFCSPAGVTPTA